jgi:Multiubiquitin
MDDKKEFKLVVNQAEKEWPSPTITGKDIKKLAGSPADWVVNEIVEGPGEDPEIGDDQKVSLEGSRKKFITRKPTTSPGYGA